MYIRNSNMVLKKIFGRKEFKELKKFTSKKVEEKFGKQGFLNKKYFIDINNSAMLIIGLVKARNYKDTVLPDFLNLERLTERKLLIEDKLEDLINVYSKYIDKVVDYMKRKEKETWRKRK